MTDTDYIVRTPYQRLHARRGQPTSETRQQPNTEGRISCGKCPWTWTGKLVPDGAEAARSHREAEHPFEKPPRPPSKDEIRREKLKAALDGALDSLKAEGATGASASEIASRSNGRLSTMAVARMLSERGHTYTGDYKGRSRRWLLSPAEG